MKISKLYLNILFCLTNVIKPIFSGEQPFSCEICGLKFSHENSLKRHGRIHQKDCKCRFCGKQFSDKSLLKIHQIMHEKELPHHCSICKKGRYLLFYLF